MVAVGGFALACDSVLGDTRSACVSADDWRSPPPVVAISACLAEETLAVGGGTNCPGGGGNCGGGMLMICCPECVYVCPSFWSWCAASRRRRSISCKAAACSLLYFDATVAGSPVLRASCARSPDSFAFVSRDPSTFGTALFAWAMAVATSCSHEAAFSLYLPSSSVAIAAWWPQFSKAVAPSPFQTTRVMWVRRPSPIWVILEAALESFFARSAAVSAFVPSISARRSSWVMD